MGARGLPPVLWNCSREVSAAKGETIMTFWKTLAFGFGLVLASAPFVSSARADEWNKETRMTFDNPVEVPGRVLLPGTYVFKVADSNSDRQIVEIYNDNDRLVTIVTAVSDYRIEPPSKTVVTF
jgi:hypothetical protein